MPSWTKEQLANYEARYPSPSPKSERSVCHAPLGETKREASNPTRRIVRIVSYRRRLLDKDNIIPKWFIDSLRYAGIIDDDTEWHIDLNVSQIKVTTKQDERTEIEIL